MAPRKRENAARGQPYREHARTKNTITFQRGRFRYRSKRRCKALSALQIIHTHYSNSMQRNTYISREYHHAGHPARHCAARHQTNPDTREHKAKAAEHAHFGGCVWITDLRKSKSAATSSTLSAFQRRRDRAKSCPGCKVMILLVLSTC